MTGFGRAYAMADGKKIIFELKSVNSKQFDLALRLPALFRDREPEIRNILAANLIRGKVEASVIVEMTGESAPVHINIDLLAAYKQQIEELDRRLGIDPPADWHTVLMRFPDIFSTEASHETSDAEFSALCQAAADAARALNGHRRAEGEKLEIFFTNRINKIAGLLAQIPQFEVERVAKIRARITDALQHISGVDYDKNRLEQEMIFYIEKLDINEEKQRLEQHLNYFIQTMNDTEGQGKKLGFIAQEIGREINTLGSKSNQADMQRIVVQMKDELEQIKEQVLNVM